MMKKFGGMVLHKYKLEEVFVPAGFPEITYIERNELKKKIMSAKMNINKHICIYGSSKCGKSNLWRKHFKENEYIKVGLNSKHSIDDVYSEILNQLNAYYISEKCSNESLKGSLSAELQLQIKMLFSSKIKSSVEGVTTSGDKKVLAGKPIISANMLIRYLKPASKRIILEDFHYANEDLIKTLAQDLKAFSDEGCQFLLISVPSRTQYLLKENVELQGRLTDLPVGMFSDNELISIINDGLKALNIEFSDEIKNVIVKEANKSAAITQDICQKVCIEKDIYETQKHKILINDLELFEKACISVAEEQKVTYEQIANTVGKHEHGNNTTKIYRWILKVIQQVPITDAGISNTEVYRKIIELGHESILQGSVTSGLGLLPKLLEKKGLPQVFEYNEYRIFFVKDKYMSFVFKWLPDIVNSLFE